MHAHIAAMGASARADMSGEERKVTEQVAQAYDMTRHARHGPQTEVIGDDFIDAHAVAGPAEDCAARLKALAHLGLDRVVLMMAPPLKSAARASYDNASRKLLPLLAANSAAPDRTR
jgi:alkanesulfonate monooxygenase SsuD/methylene tetrahydromethanopterin reductase-like flavin-dependent oxidoreductase (luciferase family)